MKTRFPVILITFILISFHGHAQSVSQDTVQQEIILEKKFTIPIEDQLEIRFVKKNPTLQIIQLRPEVNPILYDKQQFFDNLIIKKSRKLREVFGSPLFLAELRGGVDTWMGGKLGFQIHQGKFHPSAYWELDQYNHGAETRAKGMHFQGGFRWQAAEKLGIQWKVGYRLQSAKYHGTWQMGGIPEWNLFRMAGLTSGFGVNYADEWQQWKGEMIYDEFHGRGNEEFSYREISLPIEGEIYFSGFSLWLSGKVTAIGRERSNPDSSYRDETAMEIRSGIRYRHPYFSFTVGGGITSSQEIMADRDQSLLYPVLKAQVYPVPGRVMFAAGYESGLERDNLLEVGDWLPVGETESRGYNMVKHRIDVQLDFRMVDSLKLTGAFIRKDYDLLHLYQPYGIPGQELIKYNYMPIAGNFSFSQFQLGLEYAKNSFSGSIFLNWLEWKKYAGITALPLVPTRTLGGMLGYRWNRWYVQTDVEFWGDRSADGINERGMESALRWDLRGEYRIHQNVFVGVTAKNIFNSDLAPAPGRKGMPALVGMFAKWIF